MNSSISHPPYSSEELARLYPQQLELKQVQVLLRHGERTPVSARFENAGLPPFWPYCKAANSMKSLVLAADDSWDVLTWKRRLETIGDNDAPQWKTGRNGETDSICQPGELTDRGRETTLALGQKMRHLYVEQLKFLPEVLQLPGQVYLRSTPVPRALESVQQAFTGLYPVARRASGLPVPSIVARSFSEENLLPNDSACKRYAELAIAFADKVARAYNGGPELAYINKKIGKWMPKDSPVVAVDSHPRLSGIMDTINATLAHGKDTKLPSEFYDEKVRADTDRICTTEWFAGYQESNEYRKLGIGSLIGDLTQRMVEHTDEPDEKLKMENFQIGLAGCHDTTLVAALASLGTFEVDKDTWPDFTSSIAFELFKDKSSRPASSATKSTIWPSREKTWWYSLFSSPKSASSVGVGARKPLSEMSEEEKSKLDGYYVRLRYNDRPLALPYCEAPGRHLDGDVSFCTLSAFKAAADSFTPRDWKAECKLNLGQPPAATIERPPGVSE